MVDAYFNGYMYYLNADGEGYLDLSLYTNWSAGYGSIYYMDFAVYYGQAMVDADWQYIVWVYNFSPWEIYSYSYNGTYIIHEDYGNYVMQGPVYYNISYYFVGYDWDDDYSYMYNVAMTGYLLFYGNYEGYFITNTYGSWFCSIAGDY